MINVEDKLNKINILRYNAVVFGKIEEINIKFIEGLKLLAEEGNEINEKYYEQIDELSNLAQYKLNIQTYDEFKKAMAIIDIAKLLIIRGIKDLDEEPLTTGFYNLREDLEELKIFLN